MKIRLGNDFAHVWVVERLGEPENLDAARDIEMYLRSANGSVSIAFAVQDGNKIRTQFTAANVPAIGDYSLLLTYIGSDSNRHTLDLDAFTIVSSSAKADQVDEFTSTSDVAIGLRGADAFQVWQSQAGNEGKTYEEYIAYLREPMTLAIEQGNDTAAEWAIAEAERVANELIREANEEDRRAAELIREQVKDATIIAKNEAIQATSDANDAASLASSKADLANDAATLANSKAGLADIAATNANSKADLAVTATTNANDAANLANSKAGIAKTAADNANAKAILADDAATNANTVSTNVANAEAARVLAGSELKTNKTSDIETNKTSVDKYATTKGVADYVDPILINLPNIFECYASLVAGVELTIPSTDFEPILNMRPANVQVFSSGKLKNVEMSYVANGENYDVNIISTENMPWANIFILGTNLKKINQILSDGYSTAIFRPQDDNWVTRDANGADIIWWDANSGKANRGETQLSGVIELFGIYEIISCQSNFFYAGCQVGDIFPCGTVKTCDANNAVKRCLGNHVCQPVATKRPIRGLFDGVDDIMRSVPFTLNQPTHIYSVLDLKTWVKNKILLDGNVYSASCITQIGLSAITTNQVRAYAGVGNSGYVNIPTNKKTILRTLFNAPSGAQRVNGAATNNNGLNNMGGLCFGGGAHLVNGFDFSNVEYSEIIVRTKVDSEVDDRAIYNYLNDKYAINDPDTVFEKGKLVITTDDGILSNYTGIMPLLQSKGVSATFYVVTDFIGTSNYITWANALEMHNLGMDIQCHTKAHNPLSTVTKENAIINFTAVDAAFIANGLPAPKHIAYPFGSYSSVTCQACEGLRYTGRTTKEGYVRKNTYRYEIPSYLVDGLDTDKMDVLKGHIDVIASTKQGMTLFTHGVDVSSGYGHITPEYLTEIIDYAKSKDVDIITMSQLHDLLNDI